MSRCPQLQRDPRAPALPPEPLAFVFHFIRKFQLWYLFIMTLETAGAISATLMPYVIGQVVRLISQSRAHPEQIWSVLSVSLLVFLLLNISEVIFVRGAGTSRAYVNPRLRRSVTRELYAYLQHHSHRFVSNNFAGALAHRISETSQGVGMALATIVFDFFPVLMKLLVSTALLFTASASLGIFVAVLVGSLSVHLV